MKTISSRQLATQSAEVWKQLAKEGPLVITRDGYPKGILIPTSDATLLNDLQEQLRARARSAVSNMRRKSQETGLAELSTQEIEAEVQASRKKCNKK
jgi:PHD/YefM family antitoxin component YafN of YafNO toxin-antitoxin module